MTELLSLLFSLLLLCNYCIILFVCLKNFILIISLNNLMFFVFFLKKLRGKQSFLCLLCLPFSNASIFHSVDPGYCLISVFFSLNELHLVFLLRQRYAHDIPLIFVYLGISLFCFQTEEYFCFIKNSWFYSLSVTLNMALHCFLAFTVSDEKSDVNVVVPLWVMNCFSVAAFRIFIEKILAFQ